MDILITSPNTANKNGNNMSLYISTYINLYKIKFTVKYRWTPFIFYKRH